MPECKTFERSIRPYDAKAMDRFRFSLKQVPLPQTNDEGPYRAQYFRMYRIRLEMLMPRLRKAVEKQFGN